MSSSISKLTVKAVSAIKEPVRMAMEAGCTFALGQQAALSHATGSAVERAYAHSDLFERRRELRDACGKFALGNAGSIVQLVRA